MVRHKSRWIIVEILKQGNDDNDHDKHNSNRINYNHIINHSNHDTIKKNKRNLFIALRDTIESAFGIAGSGVIEHMFVKYIHTGANIAIVKIPRDHNKLVRAAILLITEMNQSTCTSSSNTNTNNEIVRVPVVISVKSMHGSARTCKIATLQILRKWFHVREQNKKDISDSKLKELHNYMEEVYALD